MGRFSFKSGTFSEDSRPIFTSNGMHVLFATGSATQVSLLEPEVLKEKFGAELVLDKVKLDPYWQIGECVGGIYRLAHFPIDGTDYDFQGLYVFNVVPTEEYKKACADPNVSAVGKVCDIIINMELFEESGKDFEEWFFDIAEDTTAAVKRANAPLQVVVDKLKETSNGRKFSNAGK